MNQQTQKPTIDPTQPQSQAHHEYAEELLRRYNELRHWAAENWPNREHPLTKDDFIASERELLLLVGARLHNDNDDGAPDAAQFHDVTPMPWP